MFKALRSWLWNSSSPPVAEPKSSVEDTSEPTAVPLQARELAHRLLTVVLQKFEAAERAADIEEMDIAPHRVLLQVLPMRVYVYALGTWMADHDFSAMLSSQRPQGAVFDAFEMEIGGAWCGFYVYCLSALSDQKTLTELWEQLRAEIGRPVKTAELPSHHTRHHGYEMVTIDGDPDDLAHRLLEPHLPSKFLDQVSIADETGCADFLAQLLLRLGKASIEKDELIRFVERNRPYFNDEFSRLLKAATSAASKTDESTGAYFKYVIENIHLAVQGDIDQMDMRSDRLFWLIYALGQLLQSKKIDIAAARSLLARPDVVQRISQHQLLYMIRDIAEAFDSPQEPPISMMLLIGECAVLGRHAGILQVACNILAKSSLQGHLEAVIDLMARSVAWLHAEGADTRELSEDLQRLKDRTQRIADDDF